MKIELKQKITYPDSEEIVKVLTLSKTSYVTLTKSFNKQYYLNINGKNGKRIALKIDSHNGLNRFCSLFRYKKGFGIAESHGKIQLWQRPFNNAFTIKIKSPYQKEDYKKPFLSQVGYDLEADLFYVGVEEAPSIGFPAKYWSSFQMHSKSILKFRIALKKQKLEKLNQLNVQDYPTTQVPDNKEDWLNILQLTMIYTRTFIFTNGGFITRTKSGPNFQFSILSEYDKSGNLVRKFEIEVGDVSFAGNNKHALLITRKNPRRLHIYSIDEMKLLDSISLTALRLEEKAEYKYFSFDMVENKLFICGRKNLYVLQLKN